MWRAAAGMISQVLRLTFAKMIFEFQYFYVLHYAAALRQRQTEWALACGCDSHEPRICSMANSDKAQRMSWVVGATGGCSRAASFAGLKWAAANRVDLAWPNPVSPCHSATRFSQDLTLALSTDVSIDGVAKRSHVPLRHFSHCYHDGISVLWPCSHFPSLDKDIHFSVR